MTVDGGGVVLVIEQDPGVVELQRLYLAREGYDVRVETDLRNAVDAVRLHRPDAVVVDLPVAEPDLYQRMAPACTADGRPGALGAAIVCVVPDGTDAPGPHSVIRPFSPRVLVAAVGRALREDRVVRATAGTPNSEDVLQAGGLTVSPGDHTVLADGSPVTLTSTEFDLLTFLIATQAGCTPGSACSPPSGGHRARRAPAPSTSTSPRCAPNSESPAPSAPYAESATASTSDQCSPGHRHHDQLGPLLASGARFPPR